MEREQEIRESAEKFLREELQEDAQSIIIEIQSVRHAQGKSIASFIVKTEEANQQIENMTGEVEFDHASSSCSFAGLDPFS